MVTEKMKKKVDSSIEKIDRTIQWCTKELSTGDISKDQVISIVKKTSSFKVIDEIFSKKSSTAEYYAKKLIEINFLENIKQIYKEIFSKSGFSVDDLRSIRQEMRTSCFKISALGKILRELGTEVWSDPYPIKINPTPDGKSYIVE